MSEAASSLIRIGVSTCLPGEKVRYDGGHKVRPRILSLMFPDSVISTGPEC